MLEDLTAQGFHILARDMSDIGNVFKHPHLNMIMERLAQIHAASLPIDWLQVLPYLKQDSFIETHNFPFPTLFRKACKAYSEALEEYYPDVDKKYSNWLKSSKPLEALLKLVKPKSHELTVLGHGDFWVNNIMFKVDSNTNLPLDVKFIDFQLCRYVPPSRDIQNLLYTCGKKALRDECEPSLLQMYVSSFNATLGYEKLKLEDFIVEYESSRLFGLSVALVFRSMNLMPDLYPSEGEEMTNEIFSAMISGVQFENMLERCHKDPSFTENVKELILELINVLDKWGV
jgi:aminoglycoside/choline kinase family phosphotransferase